ncbi:MAG: hypothetical protein RIK87_15690 [Fuerstiella sp.]
MSSPGETGAIPHLYTIRIFGKTYGRTSVSRRTTAETGQAEADHESGGGPAKVDRSGQADFSDGSNPRNRHRPFHRRDFVVRDDRWTAFRQSSPPDRSMNFLE